MPAARLLFAVAALVRAAPDARASIILSAGQTQYILKPAESVTVPITLEFTADDAAALESDGGLLSAAFSLTRIDTSPAKPVNLSGLKANAGDFNDPVLTPIFASPSFNGVGIWEFADITRSVGVLGASSASGDRTVTLGQATFIAGSDPGATTFAIGPYDPNLQTTVTFNAPSITLDGSIMPSTVVFDVVPEPGPVLLALAIVPMLRRSFTQ